MKFCGLFLLLLLCGQLNAQYLKEKYSLADQYRQKYNAGYYGNITPSWIGDSHCLRYSVKTAEGTDFILADAGKKNKETGF